MSDPLSISASVVGLVVPALEGTRLLVDTLRAIRDAPKALQDIETDLKSVEASLGSLKGIDESQLKLLSEQVYDQCRDTISRYKSACDGFRGDIQRCTKRTRDGKLSWRDKVNVGFFNKKRIEGMSRQLQSCKLTLNSVLSVATLYSTIRNTAITEEIKSCLSAKQMEMTGSIALVDSQVVQAERSLAQLNQTQEDTSDQQYEEDTENLIWALEEEVAMLRSSQETMKELLSSIRAELTETRAGAERNVATNVSFGANNSGFQVGTSSGPISGLTFGMR